VNGVVVLRGFAARPDMNRPLRICIVVTYDLAKEGGVKRHAVHLAEELRTRGDYVDILGPNSGHDPLPPGTYGFPGVVNVSTNGSNSHIGIFTCPYHVWRKLRESHYDVLHVMEPHVPTLAWYAAWFARPAVRVATFHAFSEAEGVRSRLARRILVRPQLALFDHGIAVSPAAERFARGAWSRPLALIPNGIDTKLYTPAETNLERRGPFKLLFVGHFRDPRKGLPTLLEAFELLRARGVEATLDVVGDGAVKPVPGVVYHGAIGDERRLAGLYRESDLFVAPSTGMESFGIVLLEAMASGLPIACSDIVGYRAVVPEAGAALVPPGEATALADAIAGLATDPARRRQMGAANRQAALQYDWADLATRVRAEYLVALRKHPVTAAVQTA
jgi:phosphatidyl-myo-inositol alpha-mannosyltransferase